MAVDMSSPIFDSTFGTGRFRYEEATKSPEPQDVRQALELQLFDLVELARDTRSDKRGEAKWVHPCGALVKEFAKRIAALAQSDAGPAADARLIEAADLAENYSDKYYNGNDLAVAVVLRDLAKQLRARATERSGK